MRVKANLNMYLYSFNVDSGLVFVSTQLTLGKMLRFVYNVLYILRQYDRTNVKPMLNYIAN